MAVNPFSSTCRNIEFCSSELSSSLLLTRSCCATRRAIQQQLENPLAQEILAGVFGPGDVIHVNVSGDGLTFSRGSNVDVDDEGAVIEGELVD